MLLSNILISVAACLKSCSFVLHGLPILRGQEGTKPDPIRKNGLRGSAPAASTPSQQVTCALRHTPLSDWVRLLASRGKCRNPACRALSPGEASLAQQGKETPCCIQGRDIPGKTPASGPQPGPCLVLTRSTLQFCLPHLQGARVPTVQVPGNRAGPVNRECLTEGEKRSSSEERQVQAARVIAVDTGGRCLARKSQAHGDRFTVAGSQTRCPAGTCAPRFSSSRA